jgi:hypothetical protein
MSRAGRAKSILIAAALVAALTAVAHSQPAQSFKPTALPDP